MSFISLFLILWPNDKAHLPGGAGAAPGSASAERRPSIRRLRERQNGSYHTIEGHRGHDLVCRASPQQRLDPFQMVQHFRQLIRSLPVLVVRPAGQPLFDDIAGQPLFDDIGGRAHQDDLAELRVELHLILGTAAHEDGAGVLGREHLPESPLTPQLVALGIAHGPARLIHVDGLEAPSLEFNDHAGFPRPRHPGQ